MSRTCGIFGPCSSAGEAREARAGQGEARREVSSNPQPSPHPLPEGEGDISVAHFCHSDCRNLSGLEKASFPETPCWRGFALPGGPLQLDSVKKVAITSDAWHPRHLS